MAWSWQPVLRCDWSPGYFDSGLQLFCTVESTVSHLTLDKSPKSLYGVQVSLAGTMVSKLATGSSGIVGRCHVLPR